MNLSVYTSYISLKPLASSDIGGCGMSVINGGLDILKTEKDFSLRPATGDDMSALVSADMQAFRSVYKFQDMSEDELAADLLTKFEGRYEKLGGFWMQVLENQGKIVGSITACPTRKTPEDFTSWEDTTDNGTLETTYDPDGKKLYVVSLSVLPEASAVNGQDMLMANIIGKIIGGDYQAYFESRMPGLKKWMLNQCRADGVKLADVSPEDIQAYSEKYYTSTIEVEGKARSIDPLLRMYQEIGCKIVKLVPDAYQDTLSMNYGAVCVYDSPLPTLVKSIPFVRRAIGSSISAVSHSNYLTRKLF
jgi:hypothetical protein